MADFINFSVSTFVIMKIINHVYYYLVNYSVVLSFPCLKSIFFINNPDYDYLGYSKICLHLIFKNSINIYFINHLNSYSINANANHHFILSFVADFIHDLIIIIFYSISKFIVF